MALSGALCLNLFAVTGVTNKSLRALTARHQLHHQPNDLRPTPPAAQRPDPPHEHTHTYVLTPDGQRLAIFYTKLHERLLRPLTAANQPQAPPALRHALATIDHHVDEYIARARLKPRPEPDTCVQNPVPKDLAVASMSSSPALSTTTACSAERGVAADTGRLDGLA